MTSEISLCKGGKCLRTLLKCISSLKYKPTFLALQEATISKAGIDRILDILGENYECIHYHQDMSDILTFYDMRMGRPKIITTTYERDRLVLALLFADKKMAFVNQHHGHNANALFSDINRKILSLIPQKYRIIIAGDFNDHKSMLAKDIVHIGNRTFHTGYERMTTGTYNKSKVTCVKNMPYYFDYILDTEYYNTRFYDSTKNILGMPLSDHRPIMRSVADM